MAHIIQIIIVTILLVVAIFMCVKTFIDVVRPEREEESENFSDEFKNQLKKHK